jgi:hypothetical protein
MVSATPTVQTKKTNQVSQSPKYLQVGHSVPIIVGVTGHRDLRPEDIDDLKHRVRAILEELRERYPSTSLLVMSPLAEGADRLVAETALETVNGNEQRAALMVPLPMPQDEYEKDFQTKSSLETFRELLSQAATSFELPLVAGNTPESIKNIPAARDKQYAQVGAYVARHSHILIALWDGEQNAAVGGTAETVAFKLYGVPAPYEGPRKALDIIDSGPVYHIVTPRIKNPSPASTAFHKRIRFPIGWEVSDLEVAYHGILSRMDQFNEDAERLLPKVQTKLIQSKAYLIPSSEEPQLSTQGQFILDRYAAADTLAIHFQRRRRATLVTLFCLALTAVLSFELYTHLLPEAPLVLALYPLSLAVAVVAYVLAGRWQFQNKHLDYRALAEGLRVQLFWNLAGLPHEVADHYLRQHRTELEWIRNAIRSWNSLGAHLSRSRASETRGVLPTPRFDIILKYWIEGQRKFFSDASYRDYERLGSHSRLVQLLFLFGLSLAVLLAVFNGFWHQPIAHSRSWSLWIVGIGSLPAIAAAIGGYAEKMAFSAQAKRYEWMTSLFTRAAEQMRHSLQTGSDMAAHQLAVDLGKEALEENGNWVAVHRERTPDVYRGP